MSKQTLGKILAEKFSIEINNNLLIHLRSFPDTKLLLFQRHFPKQHPSYSYSTLF